MIALLAGVSVMLVFASAWQLAGERGEAIQAGARRLAARFSGGRIRSLAQAALALGIGERIERAGLARRIAPVAVLAAKGGGVLTGLGCAALVAGTLPGRLSLVAVPALGAAGFLAPDALLERRARLRQARLVDALPDALDLLAVGAAAGRPPATVIREISAEPAGPLAIELAITVAGIDCGEPQGHALAELRERVPARELAALAAAIERSRRYGSPLADQLRDQAEALRADAGRRISEAAARAAPKIQLVVAMVLVPSVLLMILAAILAHSDALFGAMQ